MKKALVTGAAGFIGSAVVKALLQEGLEVRAMVLPGEDRRNLQDLEVEIVEGDVLDPPSLERALKGCDTLFHLAAIYAIWLKDRSRIYKVNLQGSRNMLWAAWKADLEKIVYTSSIAAIGVKPGKEPADENTEFNTYKIANDYVLSKYLSQEEALTFARQGLPLVVVNPAFPFGEGDVAPTPTGRIIIEAVNGTNPFYFAGGINAVDVMDVARGHLLAARKGRVGEKYILGNQNLTIREFMDLVGKVAGVRTPKIRIPVAVAKFGGWLMEKRAERTGITPLSTPKDVTITASYLFYDVSKAKNELGLSLTPIEDSIRRAVEWFRKNGYILR